MKTIYDMTSGGSGGTFDRSLKRMPHPVRGCKLGLYAHVSLIHGPENGFPAWENPADYDPAAWVAFADKVMSADCIPDLVMFDWEGPIDDVKYAAAVRTVGAFYNRVKGLPNRPKVGVFAVSRLTGRPDPERTDVAINEGWAGPQHPLKPDPDQQMDVIVPKWLSNLYEIMAVSDVVIAGSYIGRWDTVGRDVMTGVGSKRFWKKVFPSKPFYHCLMPYWKNGPVTGGEDPMGEKEFRQILELLSETNIDGIIVWGGGDEGQGILKKALRNP